MSLRWRDIGDGLEWGYSGAVVVAGVSSGGRAFWIALFGKGFEARQFADRAAAKKAVGQRWAKWLKRAALAPERNPGPAPRRES